MTNLVGLEQKGSCAGHDPSDRRRILVEAVADRVTSARPLFASTTRSLSELFRRYSEADLAVIADFLKRNAERLREREARVHATCRGRGAPMNPVLSIVVGLAAVGAGLWRTSWAIEAMRRVPKAPSRLPWAPAIPIEMIDVGGASAALHQDGTRPVAGPSPYTPNATRLVREGDSRALRHFTVYALDYPGHGFSDIPRARYDAAFFTAAVEGFIERLELRDITWRASRSVERSRSSSPRVAIRVSRGWSPSTPTTTPRAGAWRAARCSAGW